MFKKLFSLSLILSLIPITQSQAVVRDSYNLREVAFEILDTFPNNVPGQVLADTTFRSNKAGINDTQNSLTNDLNVKGEFIQIFIPFHPNITIVNCSKVSQFGCAAQFPSTITLLGNSTITKEITFSNLYTFSQVTVGDNTNLKGPLGWSTIIEVPRNFFDFRIDILTDLENNTNDNAKKLELKELLDRELQVAIVSDPNAISYQFNNFNLSQTNDSIRSLNNQIPPTAIKEMIIYIDHRFSNRYTGDGLLLFFTDNGTFLSIQAFSQAQYTKAGNLRGYYVFDISTALLNNATKFDLQIVNPIGSPPLASGELTSMNNSFYYNFDEQIHYATFKSGLNVLGVQPFSILIPRNAENFILPSGHSFWQWINDENNQSEIFDETYAPNQDVTLFSSSNSVVVAPPIVPDVLGGINGSFDTILINTGFLNPGGLMLLYFICFIAVSILVFNFKLSNFIAIILNVLLTSVFLILGYLPLFTSILLIAFYIIALISINKGGFLNE